MANFYAEHTTVDAAVNAAEHTAVNAVVNAAEHTAVNAAVNAADDAAGDGVVDGGVDTSDDAAEDTAKDTTGEEIYWVLGALGTLLLLYLDCIPQQFSIFPFLTICIRFCYCCLCELKW